MLRQKHQWTITLSLAVALGLATWALGEQAQARKAEVRQNREAEGIQMLEFQALLDRGAVLVVDVRDHASFVAGRIAGAIHVALKDLEGGDQGIADVRELARGRLVVAYCSCPTEASSLRAARALRAKGVNARALVGGYLRWVDAGGRTEHGVPVP